MNRREELQSLLEELLGNKNVYYQAPENLKIEYPCIRYSTDDIELMFADNKNYNKRKRYELIIIDKLPDNEVINKILDLPLSSYDRHYTSNNLNHDVITLYY
jgi:hypothetical protein